ncbi:hypothetical protein ACFQ60_38635 [Streptomyces zhihengii]|uniref:Secreted protein n=1 Tax=Streptomyces zhihengii TaxID=1818004 RepID=A0ABS2ULG5_9ACTN|nr:hypothetical protein [Streptomyces zhihengii]MBM9618382.1 hypothetical protein [Streptomyces zhihengii]
MRIKSAVLPLGIAAVCTALAVTPAAAYNDADLTQHTWTRDTGQCLNTCVVESWEYDLDGTFFQRDIGGKALKMHIREHGKTIAQVEFHPYDEVLHVYDGANDGDTVYVRLKWDEGPFTDPVDATYWAPGTSAVIDHNSVQLAPDDDIDEGTEVQLRVYDDKALTDPITGWYEVRA